MLISVENVTHVGADGTFKDPEPSISRPYSTVVATIEDDEARQRLLVSFVSLPVIAEGVSTNVQVQLNNVNPSTTNLLVYVDATTNTASTQDYTIATTVISIAPGATIGSVVFETLSDNLFEGTETVTFRISRFETPSNVRAGIDINNDVLNIEVVDEEFNTARLVFEGTAGEERNGNSQVPVRILLKLADAVGNEIINGISGGLQLRLDYTPSTWNEAIGGSGSPK